MENKVFILFTYPFQYYTTILLYWYILYVKKTVIFKVKIRILNGNILNPVFITLIFNPE